MIISPNLVRKQKWVYTYKDEQVLHDLARGVEVSDDRMDPHLISEANVASVGIDLTIFNIYSLGSEGVLSKEDRQVSTLVPVPLLPKLQATKRIKGTNKTEIISMEGAWMLLPGYYLWDSYEQVSIPAHAMAKLTQRSTCLRMGIEVDSSIYDPAFRGGCGGRFIVHHPVRLERGSRVAQILFYEAQDPNLYDGVYQETTHLSSSTT